MLWELELHVNNNNRMKRLFALFVVLSGLSISLDGRNDHKSSIIPFADPFILYEDGLYYLYGTGSDNGIPVVVSKDMKTWEWPEGNKKHLALHKKDSYGKKWFWAPEVYRVGDRYIMYYSAEEHICMAESDSPLGPFRQTVKKPMREQNGIDNHLFINQDGTPYLYWVNFNDGNEVCVAKLEQDLATIIPGTEKFCIRMSQDWEKVWPSVNEGPFVIFHEGKYYMTYSANSYECPEYGVGVAVADNPEGPWVKYDSNPVLQSVKGLEGVGHHALFKDAKGRDRIVFHSHNAPGKVQPRIIHIGYFGFKNERNSPDVFVVKKKFFTPCMSQQ